MTLEEEVRSKFRVLGPLMNEKTTRLWAALEAKSQGHGGVARVHQVTGISRNTINTGLKQLKSGKLGSREKSRSRRSGGGRKRVTEAQPEVLKCLEQLVATNSRGDPQSPLRWTSKSTRNLAEELKNQGHNVSHATVASLLSDLGYSLQGNQKTLEGSSHPDRNVRHQPAPYSEFPVSSDKLNNGGIVYGICGAEEKIDIISIERRKA
jgi:transposase